MLGSQAFTIEGVNMETVLLVLVVSFAVILPLECQEINVSKRQSNGCGYEELRIAAVEQIRKIEEKMDTLNASYQNKVREGQLMKEKLDAVQTLYKNEKRIGEDLRGNLTILEKSLDDVIRENALKEKERNIRKQFERVVSSGYSGYVDVFDDKVFFVSRFQRYWHGAQTFCRDILNASLAYDLDVETNAFLKRRLNSVWNNGNAWIGGKGGGSNWYWVTRDGTQERIQWSDWERKQPDGTGCVRMWVSASYRWDDYSCYSNQRFICMRSLHW